MKDLTINTGTPRNVLGHVISGAIASAVVSSAINYKKMQNKQISRNDAIKDTVKRTSQGAIATGSAIATANYIGQNSWLKAVTALSIGAAGIYALEVLEEKIEQKYLTNENIEIEGE
ncbi:magnetosome protein MamC [Aliarcobacter butzleri]|uniref:magnetosome protein MamC n=1 Tax=Aliarcobacter butzleri TaxID=28197 RepID=UPI00116597DF|nr:magnetosome protein MamC [Aliarcobacter butzleri]MCG3672292.1 magnetosome protein MamC [Aliarcobacter butzleri]MCG3690425.1 magnetosome protein MamC [Aliarcobacter butzleri]MCT7560506.1 magnetosome protein MamC [Aliarcobacter butzleri]MCT7568929.1 magnetosome protein MamC [Aliarcobacter butzleri]MCT7628511.1 magnetosome protein MamC [Aliarcobacter butzleri]